MADTTITTGLATMATAPLNQNRYGRGGGGEGSWFEALSDAWGKTLDREASKLQTMSESLGNSGNDNPSQVTQLTAEAMRMSFLSNSSSSSIDSVGKSLETMARKN